MAGEPFHKTGVTVPAAMAAPHIGINAVIKAGDARFGENRFGKDFSYLHRKYYNGVTDNPKGLLLSSPNWREQRKAGCDRIYSGNFPKWII
jgi:hypothetical protein